jgi:chorismate mutase
MEEEATALEERRRNIDRIDKTIVALLAERMRQGLAAGDLKRIFALIIEETNAIQEAGGDEDPAR